MIKIIFLVLVAIHKVKKKKQAIIWIDGPNGSEIVVRRNREFSI